MNAELFLAIDPGLTGAFCLMDWRSERIVAVEDLPVMQDAKTKWIDSDTLLGRWLELREGRETTAIIERVHAMPKNGSVAAFSQGCTFGALLATLQMARVRIEFVSPRTWKSQLGLVSREKLSDIERKRRAIAKARLLYPSAPLSRAKDHGRAEAILIAHWRMKPLEWAGELFDPRPVVHAEPTEARPF